MMHWTLPSVRVNITDTHLVSTFYDGVVNYFDWDVTRHPDYIEVAERAGYIEPIAYAIEHDLTHHWLAEKLGWPYSFAVHNPDVDYELGKEMSPIHSWEEHVVNCIQRYINTGEGDKYNVLERLLPILEIDKLKEFYASGTSFRPA